VPILGWSEGRRAALEERRDGWEVRVYAGVDPVTGKQRRISRQVCGSRRRAEEEAPLKRG
jgi:hypothetical protein